MLLLPLIAGALSAILLYLAAVLVATGVRLERVNRRWRLLDERQPFFLDALTDFSLDPLVLDPLLTPHG